MIHDLRSEPIPRQFGQDCSARLLLECPTTSSWSLVFRLAGGFDSGFFFLTMDGDAHDGFIIGWTSSHREMKGCFRRHRCRDGNQPFVPGLGAADDSGLMGRRFLRQDLKEPRRENLSTLKVEMRSHPAMGRSAHFRATPGPNGAINSL